MLSRAAAFVWILTPLALLGGACSSASSGAMVDYPLEDAGPEIHTYAPDVSSDAAGPIDTAVGPSSGTEVTQGNPICHSSRLTGCYPDTVVDACDMTDDADAAATDAGDGGPRYPGGCHVVTTASGVQTVCLPSKLQGMYASTCTQSADCSPGWECVAGGTCRHYCCSGNSACSSNQFCDVQPTEALPTTKVPVCVTESPCTLSLLGADACPSNQQCSVVREDGTTSCVAVGPQGDGESCELDHCAAGFVCLGAPGSRQCTPLCNPLVPHCSSGRSCVGGLPLFPNPLIGACQ
jgi:hypothetical protein